MAGSTLGAILRVAQLTAVRRLGRGARQPWRAALTVALIGAGLVGLGAALLPAEIGRGDEADPGGVALEMAFWLTCLASAVSTFRLLEALFRTGDARKLAPLPVSTRTLFAYRLIGAAREAGVIALGGAALFAPVAWRGDLALYGACVWVWWVGMLVTLCVGLGVLLYAGVHSLPGVGSGGGAQAPMSYQMAPGLSLSLTVVIILIEKLVAEDFLRRGFGPGARVGVALGVGVSLLSLAAAYRWFTRHFHAIFAQFLQQDLFVLDVGYEYFKEGARAPSRLERTLPAALLPLARKDRLQYRRRYLLSRLLVWGVALGLGAFLIASGAEALPLALVVVSPLGVVVMLASPWARLCGEELEPGMGSTLPLTRASRERAQGWVALREALSAGLLLSAAVLVGLGAGGPGWGAALALAALAWALVGAAHPLLMAVARRTRGGARAHAAGGALVAAALGLGALSVWLLAPLALLMLAGGALLRGARGASDGARGQAAQAALGQRAEVEEEARR